MPFMTSGQGNRVGPILTALQPAQDISAQVHMSVLIVAVS